MKHIFPFAEIPKGEKIVLYGASERGYDFYRQLISSDYAEVVLWVDRQYEWYRYMNLPVDAPSKIMETKYDRIVITAEKESVFISIKKDLAEIGVDTKKVFWKENCNIVGDIAFKYDSLRILKESEDAVLADPVSLLRPDRMDIIIKYLYASDILHGIREGKHKDMYFSLIVAQNGGNEPTENLIASFFTEYSKKEGVKAFDESFRKLVVSMKNKGFLREYFIPLDSNGVLLNGAHRLSTALALKSKVWVRKYPFVGALLDYSVEWLKDNHFSDSEIDYLVNIFNELKS